MSGHRRVARRQALVVGSLGLLAYSCIRGEAARNEEGLAADGGAGTRGQTTQRPKAHDAERATLVVARSASAPKDSMTVGGAARLAMRNGRLASESGSTAVRTLRPNEHPRPELIVRPAAPRHSLALGTASVGTPALFVGATRIATLGAHAGQGGDGFGRIERVAIGHDGYIYVLDRELNEVRVFDASGRPVQRLGPQYRQPAPFRTPAALASTADGRLLVADKTRRVHVYVRDGDSLRFERSIRLSVGAFDLCLSGDEFAVQGATFEQRELLRSFALDGRELRAYAPVYDTDDNVLRYTFAQGRIACAGRVVVLAPETSIPDVRAFKADGTPAWVTTLEGYLPVRALVHQGGAVEVTLPPRYHRAHSLSVLPDGNVLLQLSLVSAQATAPGQELAITSILLQASDGSGQNLGTSLPPIMAVGSDRYAVVRHGRQPSVEVWSFGARAARGAP
jgi:hypothetical protein